MISTFHDNSTYTGTSAGEELKATTRRMLRQAAREVNSHLCYQLPVTKYPGATPPAPAEFALPVCTLYQMTTESLC
ncbi:hypothetical protein EVAR_83010_1 [Eumeta japonica]|uniref:Uncharacterized protein n=1 Tax=Eumeta variegata TaxID=151549 RepID=A0A4C2A9E3_EUMVA|nr:hypothetical protein EVAR_83010_1 [Eumeta japonica]